MSKSGQIGGGGGGTEMTPHTEPKPLGKRPWRKPRVYLVDFAQTEANGVKRGPLGNEGADPSSFAYDPNIS